MKNKNYKQIYTENQDQLDNSDWYLGKDKALHLRTYADKNIRVKEYKRQNISLTKAVPYYAGRRYGIKPA